MAYLVILVRLSSLVALKDGVVLLVTRRLAGDTYTVTHNNSHVLRICQNLTFLLNERRCVENEELFNGSIKLLYDECTCIIMCTYNFRLQLCHCYQ